jgi:hypothetical protein
LQNVISSHAATAEEHFAFLCSWVEELRVPAKRRHQLLHAGRFGWFEHLKHRLWLWRNRAAYELHYRHYARAEPAH